LKTDFNFETSFGKSFGKSVVKITGLTLLALTLVHCTPSAKQLKEAIEKDPSIVFAAIEKDPEKFIEVVNRAAQSAQAKAQQKSAETETSKRNAEFENPLKPEIDETRTIFGAKTAPITIVEYSDFECPYCSRGYQTIRKVKEAYGDQVRVLFKHLPLEFHPKALPAAKYYEAVALQSQEKAEKFHNELFEKQGSLKSDGETFMKKVAKDLGVDMKKLDKDLKDESLLKRIEADMEEAKKFGISGTPAFIINGVSLRGAYPEEHFKEIIDRHLKK
jgi:protein-disulfide isomerase